MTKKTPDEVAEKQRMYSRNRARIKKGRAEDINLTSEEYRRKHPYDTCKYLINGISIGCYCKEHNLNYNTVMVWINRNKPTQEALIEYLKLKIKNMTRHKLKEELDRVLDAKK